MAGFSNLQSRAVALLDDGDRSLIQAYADGVNAFISLSGEDLPLEFRSLGIRPQPYAVEELGGTIPVNAWFLQANYLEELIAFLDRRTLTVEKWNELFAAAPGADLPPEDFFDRFREVRVGPLIRAALAFYPSLAVSMVLTAAAYFLLIALRQRTGA